MPVRVRFAPSPTGYLHIGAARSALFNWLFARKVGGKFLLRIEDTDLQRSTDESTRSIIEGLEWLGLDYDEGPYYQMQRLDRYKAVLDQMLARDLAYRCYTTPQELEALRTEQMARGEKPRYDGRWRPENMKPGQTPPPGVAPVFRFKNPSQGTVAWDDQVKGRIEIANAELDDLVIVRRDGIPTYNFGVIVDDLDMAITHVIRGDDHVNNTPRQINMIRALGADPPVYGHLPTVLGADGAKLSKRHGAVSVMQYADDGFLPDAMINALARVGWAHGDDDKLHWVNHEHIKRLSDDALGERLRPFLQRSGLDVSGGPSPASVAALLRDRAPTLAKMAAAAHYFYAAPTYVEGKFAEQMTDAVRGALPDLDAAFGAIDWTREAIGAAIKTTAATHGLKASQIMMAVRALVAGVPQTPAIDAVLTLLGRERTRERIKAGLEL